jgi:hypothetical protein
MRLLASGDSSRGLFSFVAQQSAGPVSHRIIRFVAMPRRPAGYKVGKTN